MSSRSASSPRTTATRKFSSWLHRLLFMKLCFLIQIQLRLRKLTSCTVEKVIRNLTFTVTRALTIYKHDWYNNVPKKEWSQNISVTPWWLAASHKPLELLLSSNSSFDHMFDFDFWKTVVPLHLFNSPGNGADGFILQVQPKPSNVPSAHKGHDKGRLSNQINDAVLSTLAIPGLEEHGSSLLGKALFLSMKLITAGLYQWLEQVVGVSSAFYFAFTYQTCESCRKKSLQVEPRPPVPISAQARGQHTGSLPDESTAAVGGAWRELAYGCEICSSMTEELNA